MVSKPFSTGTPDEAIRSKQSGRKYFYLDDKLYKYLRHDNGHDSMVVWSYDDAKIVELSLSYAKKKRRPTYTITQAAAMLNRSRMNINHLYLFEVMDKPKRSYFIGNLKDTNNGTFRLQEKDIYKLHEYYANSRKYKTYDRSAKPLPSRRELANLLKYEQISYLRTKDGDFVPTWKAPDIDDWLQ